MVADAPVNDWDVEEFKNGRAMTFAQGVFSFFKRWYV
jgi:penicillin-binding protein 2X